MRYPEMLLTTLCGLIVSATATSGPNYGACLDALDAPACIARKALTVGRPGGVTDAIIRHGLIDQVPRNSRRLAREAREQIGDGEEFLKTLGVTMPESPMQKPARAADSKVILAAVALLTAARHLDDPFADPTVQALTVKASNHPMIPFIALELWNEIIKGGNSFDKSVEFAGLPAIWREMVARRDSAPEAAYDIAGWLAFYRGLGDEPKKFLLWYAARPTLTASDKAEVASQLARYYFLVDEPERLMSTGGDAAPDYDVAGIHAEIAVAQLKSGYDAKAARAVVSYVFDEMMPELTWLTIDDIKYRDALEKADAAAELREIAGEYLRRTQGQVTANEAGNLYASASDCYRRAGDREMAREIARKGLPFVAEAVRARASRSPGAGDAGPKKLAAMAQGFGTAPVITLYRAGAIDEALKFGYLAGKDRYENATVAGEPRNPQWVLDDGWPLHIWSMVTTAIMGGDPASQRQVFDAMKKSCSSGYAECDEETLVHLAGLAAAMGDRAEVKAIAAARLKQLDKGSSESSFWAFEFSAEYAHVLELLGASH